MKSAPKGAGGKKVALRDERRAHAEPGAVKASSEASSELRPAGRDARRVGAVEERAAEPGAAQVGAAELGHPQVEFEISAHGEVGAGEVAEAQAGGAGVDADRPVRAVDAADPAAVRPAPQLVDGDVAARGVLVTGVAPGRGAAGAGSR